MQTETNNTRTILGKYIEWKSGKEILFYGFAVQQGALRYTRFTHTARTLYSLLLQNGKRGTEIIHALTEARAQPHAVPLKIDLVELFGTMPAFKCKTAGEKKSITG